ncbi:MAG: DNA-binding protein [Nitrospirota bacterium]|jgi:predicted DNA-binding protein with PD1-like motif
MNYQTGRAGRVTVVRFDDGDEVLGNIARIARTENIRAAVLYLVGGMRRGRFVVGPETENELPPRPLWRELAESHEVLGVGTVFWQGEEPRVHLHGAFGKGDQVRVGCLREQTETFLVLEAVIIEIEGVTAVREMDPATGMALLKL